MNFLSVFLGCGLGGLARYALTRWASAHFATAIPPGTFAVNVLGSFLIGFFFALFKDSLVPPSVRLLITTGFLGGFTTFSTYALESVLLFEKHEFRNGALNLLLHNGAGLAAAVLGVAVFSALRAAAHWGNHA